MLFGLEQEEYNKNLLLKIATYMGKNGMIAISYPELKDIVENTIREQDEL